MRPFFEEMADLEAQGYFRPFTIDEEQSILLTGDADNTARLAEQDRILAGREGTVLLAVSANDGRRLSQYKLDELPVWDGMAAANGKLYVATQKGNILCLEKK